MKQTKSLMKHLFSRHIAHMLVLLRQMGIQYLLICLVFLIQIWKLHRLKSCVDSNFNSNNQISSMC